MIKEQWRDVVGFEGSYQVSSIGRVRSLTRTIEDRNGMVRLRVGQVLRPAPSKSGHLSVVLGRGNTRQVHTLVLQAFRGLSKDGEEGLHINHIPSDNRLKNLKWGTRSENLSMDYSYGNQRRAHPVRAHLANGTTLDFPSVRSAARHFQCHSTAVQQAIRLVQPIKYPLTFFESLR